MEQLFDTDVKFQQSISLQGMMFYWVATIIVEGELKKYCYEKINK